jgi:hypothetical protein
MATNELLKFYFNVLHTVKFEHDVVLKVQNLLLVFANNMAILYIKVAPKQNQISATY